MNVKTPDPIFIIYLRLNLKRTVRILVPALSKANMKSTFYFVSTIRKEKEVMKFPQSGFFSHGSWCNNVPSGYTIIYTLHRINLQYKH